MTKGLYSLFIAGIMVFGLVSFIYGQINPFDIEFPIPELGNCASIEECRDYCDSPANSDACIAFSQARGFISDDEADEARKFQGKTGPGGCQGEECRAFCERPENHIECINFAEREGFISSEEAAQARKFAGRSGPGGCNSRESCEAFCSQPGNEEVCIRHAVENEFMSQEEADRVLRFIREGGSEFRGPRRIRGPEEPELDEDKARELISTIGGPGGCQSFAQCERFCSTSANDEVCFNYAIEHELIPARDIERFKRLMQTEGPGGCQGRECEFYCEEAGHELECLEFARDQGFIDEEEYQQAKRFLEVAEAGGPGGCRARECEAYCNDPAHRDECFAFAKEHGLVPPEEIEAFERIDAKIKESGGPGGCRGEECHVYCSDPSHFDECAAFAVDVGLLSPEDAKRTLREFIEIERLGPPGDFGPDAGFTLPSEFGPPGSEFGPPVGEFGPPPGFEAEFEKRFQQFEIFRKQFEGGFPPPGGFPGPGPFPGAPPAGGFPPPGEFPGLVPPGVVVCPLLPTVDVCPAGEQKVVAHSFSECGTYYICQSIEQPVPQPIIIGPEPIPTDPAIACQEKGGIWDGAANFCKFLSDVPTTTQPPSTTIDPAVQCVNEGGTWDGITCVFPASLQQLPRANPTLGSLIANLFAPFIHLLSR